VTGIDRVGGGRVAGAVLAGGASSRMGRDKALIPIEGVPMVARVATALHDGGCDPVVVVGGHRDALAQLGLQVVDDGWPGQGPLGGILTALRHTGLPTLVVACDVPWLDAVTVGVLVEGSAAAGDADVIVAATERLEPLCAVWPPALLAELEARFAAGVRAVHEVLGGVHVRELTVPAAALRNVNTPGDLPPA
jgi:molybdopterin-guanine dinucleotide biosynthesis protein A